MRATWRRRSPDERGRNPGTDPAFHAGYKLGEWRSMQEAVRTQKVERENEGRHDLRGTLEWLKAQGDLIETDKPVDPDLEVTGLQKHLDGGCPVLFQQVKGRPNHRVVTNLFGDINVINKMFGWKDD